MKRSATLILACLLAATAPRAQEQIKSIITNERDSAYYQEQTQLWRQVVDKEPQNENAWLNLYQAANYMRWYVPEDSTAKQVLSDMEQAIPQSYNYFWCRYKESAGGEEANTYAEEALKRLPAQPSFTDYDMWTSYLAMRFDERRLSDLCERYYQSGLYSPTVLQYNYNELQGMDEGGIYIGNGDAVLIPKYILQYGKKVHQDKLVICMSFLAIPEYRQHVLSRLGIDTNLDQYERPQSQEDYDRNERELINLIITHTKRPVYFSPLNQQERNQFWVKQLYNEGLILRYSPTKYDNFSVKLRNVEERFLMEYLLVQFTPDQWTASNRLSANYSVMLADVLEYYKKHNVKRYKWLMNLLVSGIEHTSLTQDEKNKFLNLLR